mmetsp:Transcript_9135/g.30048  ORF Transcript_9135/g.30048 Transcript_9135/m.30048 type:complete len:296 (+) Transcript_9135:821-1708(+)
MRLGRGDALLRGGNRRDSSAREDVSAQSHPLHRRFERELFEVQERRLLHAPGEERVGRRLRRHNEPASRVVEAVYEADPPPRLVPPPHRHHRDVLHKDGVKLRRECEVIGRPERSAAQVRKVEAGARTARARNGELAPKEDVHRPRLRRRALERLRPLCIESLLRGRSERRQIRRIRGRCHVQCAPAVIHRRRHLDRLNNREHPPHERLEEHLLEAVAVELLRRTVRRKDEHSPALNEALQNPLEPNRGEGIRHLELVEAQNGARRVVVDVSRARRRRRREQLVRNPGEHLRVRR